MTTPTYIEPLSPEQIEAAIDRARRNIARGVRVVSDAEEKARTAARAYDRAYAQAYLDHEGPQQQKRYAAELATEEEREAKDVAELAYRHAQRVAEGLRDELSALQSIARSVAAVYASSTGFGGS